MKAKITLLARVPRDGKFPFVRIQVKKNQPVPIEGATSYYLRFSEDGKQVMRPAGTDWKEACLLWANKSVIREYEKLGVPAPVVVEAGRLTLAEASRKYFQEKSNLDPKSLGAYHLAIDPFVEHAKKTYIDDITREDLLDYRDWLAKQPAAKRAHGNKNRTDANRLGHVAIFLKAFGREKLLKKSEYPKFHKKKIVAHTQEELDFLQARANSEEKFLLKFFVGSMLRDAEATMCRYEHLTGSTLTVYGKQHKTRTVELPPKLVEAIRQRRELSKSDWLFPNGGGSPNHHLLRDLQGLAKRAGAKFHTELHKLRKTGASRRYLAGEPLMTLMYELGHESLQTTQIYLEDVKPAETKRAIAAADFGD